MKSKTFTWVLRLSRIGSYLFAFLGGAALSIWIASGFQWPFLTAMIVFIGFGLWCTFLEMKYVERRRRGW